LPQSVRLAPLADTAGKIGNSGPRWVVSQPSQLTATDEDTAAEARIEGEEEAGCAGALTGRAETVRDLAELRERSAAHPL
jgi:hypothetical protein